MTRKNTLKIASSNLAIVASIVALIFVFALVFQHSHKQYGKSVTAAKSNIEQLTKMVTANIEITFDSVDQTLQRIAERQYFNMLFGKTLTSDMEHNISLWVNKTPHIEAIMVTNEQGIVELLFRKGEQSFEVKPGFKFSMQEHFNKHRYETGTDLLISPTKSEGSNLIYVSRRITNIDGSFGGLVLAVVDGNYLTDFLKSIENESHSNVAVMLDDGKFLVGGKDDVFQVVTDDFKDEKSSDVTIVDKVANSDFTLFSKQHLATSPIAVMLSMNEDDIFREWYKQRREYILFSSVFAIFITLVIAFSYTLSSQVDKIQQSERKALLASQTKSDFLAKMSHELRTPLNAIIGFSDMLSSGYFGKVTQDQVERLNDINMCGNHLLDLINDVLDFSKAEAGKLTLKEESVDLYATTLKVMRILEQKAKIGHVRVVNAIPRDTNPIRGDARKIKQILINLLANSIKFTPGGGKVILSAHLDKERNLVITVSDTGRGIDPKDIPRALTLFEQVHGDSGDQGTGIGLPLCKLFTEMHGGAFRLESKVGVGTTAYVTLPHKRIRMHRRDERLVEA